MKNGKRRFHTFLLTPIIALSLTACDSGKGVISDDSDSRNDLESVPTVETVRAVRQPFERTFDVNGLLVAERHAQLRALVDGPITEIHVEIGHEVKEGDPLLQTRTIDAELALQTAEAALAVAQANWIGLKAWRRDEEIAIMRARVLEAEANVLQLTRDEERVENLFRTGVTPESRYDEAQRSAQAARARLEIARQELRIAETGASLAETNIIETQVMQAQAQVSTARQGLADTTLRAPFDGIVTGRFVRVGDFARRGEETIEVSDVTSLTAEYEVPERYAPLLQVDGSVKVKIPAVGKHRMGRILAVNAAIDTQSRTFLVKVTVPNEDLSLKSGAFCTGTFHLPDVKDGLAVPASSVVSIEGRSYLWTVKDGQAHRAEVTTGERTLDVVQIIDGVAEGDIIIKGGFGSLSEGDSVRIADTH